MQVDCTDGYIVLWWLQASSLQVTLEDGHIELSTRDGSSPILTSPQTYMDGLLHYVSVISDSSGWVEWLFCQSTKTFVLFSLVEFSSIFSETYLSSMLTLFY